MFVVEHKGTTLHLLKQSSKPVAQVRKRAKLSVYGEQQRDEEMVDMGATRAKKEGASGFGQNGPNIIGNQEDKQSDGSMASSFKPPFDPNKSGQGFNPNTFQSITPKRTEEQNERGPPLNIRQQMPPQYQSKRNKSKERLIQ